MDLRRGARVMTSVGAIVHDPETGRQRRVALVIDGEEVRIELHAGERKVAAEITNVVGLRGLLDTEAEESRPYVCPGCYAVNGRPCAPDCVDAEIERDRERAEEERDMYGCFEDDEECDE